MRNAKLCWPNTLSRPHSTRRNVPGLGDERRKDHGEDLQGLALLKRKRHVRQQAKKVRCRAFSKALVNSRNLFPQLRESRTASHSEYARPTILITTHVPARLAST